MISTAQAHVPEQPSTGVPYGGQRRGEQWKGITHVHAWQPKRRRCGRDAMEMRKQRIEMVLSAASNDA